MATEIFTVASESFATGDGMTYCILYTRAYPKVSDYEKEASFVLTDDNKHSFDPGVLKNTGAERALSEFKEIFGNYYAFDAEVKAGLDFESKAAKMLVGPAIQSRLIDWNSDAGNIKFHAMIHVNFS